MSRKCTLLLVFSFIFLLCFPSILTIYDNSLLSQRSEENITEDIRMVLLFRALDVGWQHFPLGVGVGNFIFYSGGNFAHNSYLELWANVGLVGVVLYLVLLFSFILEQWKRYKCLHDKVYLYFFIFGVFYFIDGFFYVLYENMWLIGFFVLVATHSEVYYNQNAVNKFFKKY